MSKRVSISHYVDDLPDELWRMLKDQTHRNLSIIDAREAQFIKFVLLDDITSLSAVITEEHVQVNLEFDRVSKLASVLRRSLGVSESIPIDMRFAGLAFGEDDILANLGVFYPDKVYFGLSFNVAIGPGAIKLREWHNYFVNLTKYITNSPEAYLELCDDIYQLIKQSDNLDFNSEQLWRRLVLLRSVPGILVSKLPIRSMRNCISELVSAVDAFYGPEKSQYVYNLVNTLEWLTYLCPSALDSSGIGNQIRKAFGEQLGRIIQDRNLPIAFRAEAAWAVGWAGIACPYMAPEILPVLSNSALSEENSFLRQVFTAAALRVGPLRSAYWWASASRAAGSFVPLVRDSETTIGAFTPESSRELLRMFVRMALKIPNRNNANLQGMEPKKKEEGGAKCKLTLGLVQQQPISLSLRGTVRFEGQTKHPLNLDPEAISIQERLAGDIVGIEKWRIHVKDIGQRLYDRLFLDHPLAVRCHALALGSIHGDERNLSIEFKSSSGFLRLPLELIYQDGFLVLKHPVTRFVTDIPFVRSPISGKELEKYKNGSRKLYILLVASDTGGIPNVDNEIHDLGQILRDLLHERGIACEIKSITTDEADYETVRGELMSGKYQLFHYAGHGSHDRTLPDNSALYFWEQKNRKGRLIAMSAHELGIGLSGTNLQFAYLSCCSSAAQADKLTALDDDFMGVADALIRNSIPAVLGFRWPVSDFGARKLAIEFYRSFVKEGDLGLALLDARRKVAESLKNDLSWMSPVLIVQD